MSSEFKGIEQHSYMIYWKKTDDLSRDNADLVMEASQEYLWLNSPTKQ